MSETKSNDTLDIRMLMTHEGCPSPTCTPNRVIYGLTEHTKDIMHLYVDGRLQFSYITSLWLCTVHLIRPRLATVLPTGLKATHQASFTLGSTFTCCGRQVPCAT